MAQQIDCKIALLTIPEPIRKEEFHLGKILREKYGQDRIVHEIWPENFVSEKHWVSDTLTKLAANPEIKILIFPQALPGTNKAIDMFKEIRDDAFIIISLPQESATESIQRANLIIKSDDEGIGYEIVKQAKKQGAKTFVHYSFPRHTSIPRVSNRLDIICKNCIDEEIKFIDVDSLDPLEAGLEKAQQFILENVPKMVKKYGKDTAFFSSNCHVQATLIKAVIETRAIFPQPCCPSPFHGFPEALGIDNNFDLHYVIEEASRKAEEKKMNDRLSTWPVSATYMSAIAGAEYAIKWLNGEVSRTSIDNHALLECMYSYMEEVIGEDGFVLMSPYTENGKTYNNYKRILMSYIDL